MPVVASPRYRGISPYSGPVVGATPSITEVVDEMEEKKKTARAYIHTVMGLWNNTRMTRGKSAVGEGEAALSVSTIGGYDVCAPLTTIDGGIGEEDFSFMRTISSGNAALELRDGGLIVIHVVFPLSAPPRVPRPPQTQQKVICALLVFALLALATIVVLRDPRPPLSLARKVFFL